MSAIGYNHLPKTQITQFVGEGAHRSRQLSLRNSNDMAAAPQYRNNEQSSNNNNCDAQQENGTARDTTSIGSPQQTRTIAITNFDLLSTQEILSAKKRRQSFLEEPFVMEMVPVLSASCNTTGSSTNDETKKEIPSNWWLTADESSVDNLLNDLFESL